MNTIIQRKAYSPDPVFQEMDRLLDECPFCRGQALVEEIEVEQPPLLAKEPLQRAKIKCSRCGATLNHWHDPNLLPGTLAALTAVDLWNYGSWRRDGSMRMKGAANGKV